MIERMSEELGFANQLRNALLLDVVINDCSLKNMRVLLNNNNNILRGIVAQMVGSVK